jgi:hypothetical protein
MGTHVHGNKLRLLRSERGRINIVTIILIAVAVGLVYCGIIFAPAYIEHYKFESKLAAVANLSHRVKDEEKLRVEIDRELKNLDMKLPYEAIQIRFDPEMMWVEFSAKYARVVELVPFGSEVVLHFDSLIVERFD